MPPPPPASYVSNASSSKVDTSAVELFGPRKVQLSFKEQDCNCFTSYFKNKLLPTLGISRFQTKRYEEEDAEAQNLLKKWDSNIHHIYNFIYSRLTPALRPLGNELFFPEGQIEADGLSVICAKLWTATFILSSEIKKLQPEQIEAVRMLYLELIWIAEKAMKVNQTFYSTQQRFKKMIMPFLWDIEDNYYSKERKAFVDPELREDLDISRPFDGLYLHERLGIESLKDLSLIAVTKSWRNLSHKEEEIPFEKLNAETRLEIVLEFLIGVLKSYQRVVLGIEVHHRMLMEATVSSDVYPVNCVHAFELNSAYLKTIWKNVELTLPTKTETQERLAIVVDHTYSYLSLSQWICDRLTEISGMVQLCYQFLSIGCHLNWQDYYQVAGQAGSVVDLIHKKQGKRSEIKSGYSWKSSERREYEEALDMFLSSQQLDTGKGGSPGGDQPKIKDDAFSPQKTMSTQNPQQVVRDFLSTEYPWLLTKLNVRFEDMKLMFKIHRRNRRSLPRK